jgi:hypothetical protein
VSKILSVFPDPMLAVLEVLRPTMPTVTFGTLLPEEMATTPVPYVMVRLDGSFSRLRVEKTATVRISVWHSTESAGLSLAETIEGVLCGYPGGSKVRAVTPLTGAFPTNDPDTGSPLSSFTVAVRLRPIVVVLYPSADLFPSSTTFAD